MNNKNYRVMKFFEPVNKLDKSRGYVRLDIRGIKGNIIVSVENLGDVKTTSEVFLYKDRNNKIKLGDINNKKGMLKKLLTFGSNNAIEDYNICAVVKDKKIIMYSNLFNATSLEQVKKLEADGNEMLIDNISKLEEEFKEEKVKEEVKNAVLTDETSKNEVKYVKQRQETFEDLKVAKEEKNNEIIEELEIVKEDEKEVENEVAEEIKDEVKDEIHKDQMPLASDDADEPKLKRTSVSSAVDMNGGTINNEKHEEAQAQSHKFKNRFEESLYNVLRDYKQVEPLSVKIKNFEWWYIPYDETGIRNGFLPYYNQIISSYYPYPMSRHVTTCAGLMKKYGHYLFGLYKERGEIVKFVYGVPGEFTKEEQPYKGVTGFKNWSYSNKENNDKHGYWLAFVNPKTGDTTEPPQIVLS